MKTWLQTILMLRRQHSRQLMRCVRSLTACSLNEGLSPRQLSALAFAWGNIGYAGSRRYQQRLWRAVGQTQGPILECGAGLSTILLGVAAAKKGRTVYSLEHNARWCQHMRHMMARLDLGTVTVTHAPLRDYGAYEWYDVKMERMPFSFGLLACDGPPAATRGGRYGLLPVMYAKMAPQCRVVIDDAHRSGERQAIDRWLSRFYGVPTDPASWTAQAELVFP